MVMPIRYEIKTGRSHTLDDGTPIWKLHYTEYHDEEDYFKAKSDSVELFKQLEWNATFNDEAFSVTYNIQGPRDMVTNILASEFLGRSQLGAMTFIDLLSALIHQSAASGQKVPWEDIGEEPQKNDEGEA